MKGMPANKPFAVIGDPVAHSLSPAMHNAALRSLGLTVEYKAIRVAAEGVGAFVEEARRELGGFNITIPHKNAVIPFLDSVSKECRLSRSVNTVVIGEDGSAVGESTDGYGLEAALRECFGLEPVGEEFLFVGCGGAARAVAFHLAAAGPASLFFANRTIERAAELVEELALVCPRTRLGFCGLSDRRRLSELLECGPVVVQSSSIGLKPGDPSPLPVELLRPELRVYDMIYGVTGLLAAARQRGCRCSDGRGMLLHQGAKSLSMWLGVEPPVEVMRKALDDALAARGR